MAKLKGRAKLDAERHLGVVTETGLACIKRDEDVGFADLGLRLDEAKRLTAALQAEMVPAQMAALGECPRVCAACGRRLAAKDRYGATFRSLFGAVPVRVRRLFVCPFRGESGAKSVAALDFDGAAVASELADVTARYAALAPFGKVAALLSELLPISGTQHASTVRNRTLRVGSQVVQAHAAEVAGRPTAQAAGPVVVGLDGGYVRDRQRSEGRRFDVIAGKVIGAHGAQHPFAFVRSGQVPASEAFWRALTAADVGANTPATVLCDGDAGFWRLQRTVLPNATPVLDWWPAAVRFEHALQAARGLGVDTAEACLADMAVRGLERAKWRLWHGEWPGHEGVHEGIGADKLRRRVAELLGYLGRNEAALVPYAARRRRDEPIATSFVESAVDEIIAWRMRWSRATVQSFLDVRTAVLNRTFEDAFRQRHPGFRPANNDRRPPAAAA